MTFAVKKLDPIETCKMRRARTHTHTHTHTHIYIYIWCGRNSELIINKNNILLKVIDTNFSTSQFTMVLNFFYIVSPFVYNVF